MKTAESTTDLKEPVAPGGSRLQVIHLAAGAISIAVVMWWLQFSTASVCCGDFDGYYHIKWSKILWQGLRSGHFPTFIWLPLTTLNPAKYADQHFLFHLLLIPFTWFSDLRLGAKVSAWLFGTVAAFSLYWLVVRYRIRYPLLWLLALLACSWHFYARLNSTKAQSISILFIVAGIFLLFERKYTWLGLAAFLYVWAYNLFVLLGVLVLIWAAVLWWSERRIEWRPVLWTGVGMLAGFVVNPYFPHNVSLFLEHFAAKSGSVSMAAGVGSEWYALDSWTFLSSSAVACVAMVVGYIAFGSMLALNRAERVRVQRPVLFALFASFLLLIATRSNRFMEYWPPFAVLFVAFTLQALWEKRTAAEGRGKTVSMVLIVVLLAAGLIYNLRAARMTIANDSINADHYEAGAAWLRSNVPPGALIYDVNWSDFPKLFFYDTTHNYVSGLDSIYLQGQHPELEELNNRLSTGQEEDPAGAMRTLFAAASPGGVRYLFVGDNPSPPSVAWFRYIMRTGQFKKVYDDKECVILQLLDAEASTASPGPVAPEQKSKWNTPDQRKNAAAEVHRRFGGLVYGTDEENFQGAPALVVHNYNADEDWANDLFEKDSASVAGEALWQLGFRKYVVTNGDHYWMIDIEGNEKFRSQFNEGPTPKK